MGSCAPKLGQTITEFVKPNRPVTRTFIHCSASSNPEVDAKTVNGWHLDNGWSCIGYHGFCLTSGEWQYGRDFEQAGAHASGYNTGSLGFSLNGLNLEDFNETQLNALRWLCNEINKAYGGKMQFWPHNRVSSKACPVINIYEVLGLDADGYMTGGAPAPIEPPKASIPMVAVTCNFAQLGLRDEHPHVAWVWGLLGQSRPAERLFEEDLDAEVRAFQRAQGLTPDGIVGAATWQRLLDVGDD